MSINLKTSIVNRIRYECQAEIAECLLAVTEHRQLKQDLESRSLLPGAAALMVESLSSTALENPTPQRLEDHAGILATLKAISQNPAVQRQAAATVNQIYAAAEGPIRALVQSARNSLERQIAEIQAAEQSFFTGYGIPGEPTSVSRAAIALRSMLNADAFSRGLDQINMAGSECTPSLNLGDLEILLQSQSG